MISVEVEGISEEQMKEFLIRLPAIWSNNSGMFDSGLQPILRNFGETENVLFGVHAYRYTQNMVFIILSEYDRTERVATFNINGSKLAGWTAPSVFTKGEKKLRDIIEGIDGNEWAGLVPPPERKGSFICPECNARYNLSVIEEYEGKLICHNCGKRVNPFIQ